MQKPGVLVIFAGGVSALLGLTVPLDWRLYDVSWSQVVPSFAPMQCDTVLGFLLCGSGLVAAGCRRQGFPLICGFVLAVLGVLTLSGYAFGIDFGISRFLTRLVVEGSPAQADPMTPNVALGFVLAAIGLMLTNSPAGLRKRALELLGSAILALGAMALFDYQTEVPAVYGWGNLTSMVLHTAIGFVLLGLSLVALAWSRGQEQETGAPRWIPLLVFVTIFMGAAFLWQTLADREHPATRQVLSGKLTHITHHITRQMETDVRGLTRLAERWGKSAGTSQTRWRKDAERYIRGHCGYHGIAWVDPSFHVRWVVAGERNNVFQNFLRVLKAQQEVTREAARKRGEITLSRVVDLLPGDKGVLVYVPIFVGRTFQGFIVGGFRVRSLFEVLFPEKTINPVSLAVWDGEQEIYHSAPTRVPPLVRGSSVEAQVNLYSAAWRMQVWPALGAMEGAQSSLPEMVLLGGYLLAGLLAVMVSVIQAARAQTRQMQAVNRVLQEHNTAHKRTEEALAKALQEQQELMKAIPDIIYTLDLAGRLIKWNVRMEIVSGFSVEELRHRPLSAFFSEESQARIGQAAEEALAKGYSAVQGWLLTKSGTAIPYQFACAPLKDDQNQVVGFAGVGRDMTERLAAERMKDEFLSVVSHELRTPLGALRGSLGLLAGGAFGPLPEKGQRMLEIAVTNTNRLMRLINDILDVERMTAGKLAMQPQACEASELMSQAVDMMQAVAERAKIALCVSPLRARLWADPDRIVQVLTNLLSNAVKFSSSDATVWLTAEQHGEQVVFQVRDEGRGIPADKLHSIFERFEQVDASDTREKGGTGLGLAICRSIVQHHKGRIWVKSALGKGSTFFFTLPVQKEEDPLPQ